MRVLFATSSLGLGHATRDLPLIKALIREDNDVACLSTGRALDLLKSEVPECSFLDVPDYPQFYTSKRMSISRILAKAPLIFNSMYQEHKLAERLKDKHDFNLIVTDGRYGIFSRKVPSYWISHQLRFISPGRFPLAELGSQFMHMLVQKKFVNVLIPDYEDDSLSGDLSHDVRFFDKSKLTYLGVLSSVEKKPVKEDVDYYISLSAGLPSSAPFESLVMDQLGSIDGRVVVSRGRQELRGQVERIGNAEVHGYFGREEQANMMNRAKRIICRSGYTTLMELAELNKKAFFVPTPGATEQVYLAKFHRMKRTYDYSDQKKFSLSRAASSFDGFTGIRRKCSTDDSVKKFLSVVDG